MLHHFEEICLSYGDFREDTVKTWVRKDFMKVILPSEGGGEVN